MSTKTSEEDRTVVISDRYLSESGIQGGKIIGEHIVIGSLIFGVSFFIIGLYAILSMSLGLGFPTNTATVIITVVIIVMGLLSIVGGCFIFRERHPKKVTKKPSVVNRVTAFPSILFPRIFFYR